MDGGDRQEAPGLASYRWSTSRDEPHQSPELHRQVPRLSS
ncbi:hypothetical protein LINPERPRIM_LOCUS8983 [Linum perenne]